MITVADILRDKGEEVYAVTADATVGEALEIMARKNVGAVLVVSDDNAPTGILSERDVSRAVLGAGSGLKDAIVSSIMTQPVQCIPKTLSVPEVMHVMTHSRFRHLPVTTGGKVVGLVSIGDVVKTEIHEQEIVIDQLEHYIAGSL